MSVPFSEPWRPAALNLYSTLPHVYQQDNPQAVAGLLTRCIVTLASATPTRAHEHAEPADDVTTALARRQLVVQAQEIVMSRRGLDRSAAFSHLVGRSRREVRSIFDVARDELATAAGPRT
jgi:AmiR/NasT family two-component response regulator